MNRRAPSKTAGRASTPKNDVEAFIQRIEHPLKQELLFLRSIILAAEPKLIEHIKWNAPSYQFEGDDRITFNFFARDKIRLVFHCGVKSHERVPKKRLIDDATGRLEWAANNRAVASFASMTEIKTGMKDLVVLIKAWLAAAH